MSSNFKIKHIVSDFVQQKGKGVGSEGREGLILLPLQRGSSSLVFPKTPKAPLFKKLLESEGQILESHKGLLPHSVGADPGPKPLS